MYKGIELVVGITVTPLFNAHDAPRVIWECHRVKKEPRPMKSKFTVPVPRLHMGQHTSPSCGSRWLLPFHLLLAGHRTGWSPGVGTSLLSDKHYYQLSFCHAAAVMLPSEQLLSAYSESPLETVLECLLQEKHPAVDKPGCPSAILKEIWGIPWLYHPLLYTMRDSRVS